MRLQCIYLQDWFNLFQSRMIGGCNLHIQKNLDLKYPLARVDLYAFWSLLKRNEILSLGNSMQHILRLALVI